MDASVADDIKPRAKQDNKIGRYRRRTRSCRARGGAACAGMRRVGPGAAQAGAAQSAAYPPQTCAPAPQGE